jgi:hypothetical protein
VEMVLMQPVLSAPHRHLLLHSIGDRDDLLLLVAATLPMTDRFQTKVRGGGQILDIAQQAEGEATKRMLVTLTCGDKVTGGNISFLLQGYLCAYVFPCAHKHPFLIVNQEICDALSLSIRLIAMDPWALPTERGGGVP